jgi:hypothetical protein
LAALSEARPTRRDGQPPAHMVPEPVVPAVPASPTLPEPEPLLLNTASVMSEIVGRSPRLSPASIPPVAHFSPTPDAGESTIVSDDPVRFFYYVRTMTNVFVLLLVACCTFTLEARLLSI